MSLETGVPGVERLGNWGLSAAERASSAAAPDKVGSLTRKHPVARKRVSAPHFCSKPARLRELIDGNEEHFTTSFPYPQSTTACRAFGDGLQGRILHSTSHAM